MEIKKTALHKIDHTANSIEQKEINEENQDLKDYIKELLERIAKGESKRKFRFDSDTTEIRSIIQKMVENHDFKPLSEASAKRLLSKEIKTQEQFGHLTDLQKGMLFQALVKVNDEDKIIIAKADHNKYLDEDNLEKRSGLPYDRKIYKALLVEFNEQNQVVNIRVYDTNAKISSYWWYDYLELTEEYTDQYNTENAFESIKKEITRIKSKSETDFNILYNRMLGYFRSNETFDMDDFMDNVVTGYTPHISEIQVNALEDRLRKLPTTKNFDSNFGIEKTVMRGKRLKNIIPLDEGKMELHINEHIENLSDVIKPIKEHGLKYLRIRTDTGYDAFVTNSTHQ